MIKTIYKAFPKANYFINLGNNKSLIYIFKNQLFKECDLYFNVNLEEDKINTPSNSIYLEKQKYKKNPAKRRLRIKDRLEEDKENKAFNVLVRAKLRKQRIHTIITPDELSRFHKNLTNVLYINFIKEEKKKKEKQMPVKKMSKTQKRKMKKLKKIK